MSALTAASPNSQNAVTTTSGAAAVVLEESTTRFRIHNAGAADLFFRAATGVTALNGFIVPANTTTEPFGKIPGTPLSLFFITAAGTATAHVIEEQ